MLKMPILRTDDPSSQHSRVELRKQHTARMNKICEEIRQVMFELHGKGIYPSANNVGRSVSYHCAILTKEGHATWKSTLKELGY